VCYILPVTSVVVSPKGSDVSIQEERCIEITYWQTATLALFIVENLRMYSVYSSTVSVIQIGCIVSTIHDNCRRFLLEFEDA
jgi:hypothetical protein